MSLGSNIKRMKALKNGSIYGTGLSSLYNVFPLIARLSKKDFIFNGNFSFLKRILKKSVLQNDEKLMKK